MGRKKSEGEFLPEMNEILEGMQELMCDEDGNPLSPDHLSSQEKLIGFQRPNQVWFHITPFLWTTPTWWQEPFSGETNLHNSRLPVHQLSALFILGIFFYYR
jgi:hypothetical protein